MITLESSKIFSSLNPQEIAGLRPSVRELHFEDHGVIFKEGDQGDGLYVIKSGLVQISTLAGSTDRRVFSKIGPGDFFGEMAVIDNEPRSATAIAEGPCDLYFIPRKILLQVL